jgi:hypothetical protein
MSSDSLLILPGSEVTLLWFLIFSLELSLQAFVSVHVIGWLSSHVKVMPNVVHNSFSLM